MCARAAPGEAARGGRVSAPRPRGGAGFTFVEVIVVVGLLAILLLAAIPQLFVPNELEVELAARQVAADMGLARRLAIARRERYVLTFSPSGGPYTSYRLADGDGNVESDFPKDFPPAVTVTGTESVTFRPSGATTAGATLTFAAGGETAQVTVLATTGRAEVSGP